MTPKALNRLISDATFDHAMGNTATALAKLERATAQAPDSFLAWHSLAEVRFQARQFDAARHAAEKAHAIDPENLYINVTLSRIWMEHGDKARAEKFGAKARILGWKDQLQNPGEQPPLA